MGFQMLPGLENLISLRDLKKHHFFSLLHKLYNFRQVYSPPVGLFPHLYRGIVLESQLTR